MRGPGVLAPRLLVPRVLGPGMLGPGWRGQAQALAERPGAPRHRGRATGPGTGRAAPRSAPRGRPCRRWRRPGARRWPAPALCPCSWSRWEKPRDRLVPPPLTAVGGPSAAPGEAGATGRGPHRAFPLRRRGRHGRPHCHQDARPWAARARACRPRAGAAKGSRGGGQVCRGASRPGSLRRGCRSRGAWP